MRENKLYNLLLPLWIWIFLPPYILIPLVGNLIIDGSVILISLKLNGVQLERSKLRMLILKAYSFGFLADLIGAAILLILEESPLPFTYFYDIWDNALAMLIFLAVIALVGGFIYLFNYRQLLKLGVSRLVCFRVALAMGIITAPWLFLIPSSVFDRGL